METETKKEIRTCLLYLNDLYTILWKRQRAGKDLDPRFGNDWAVLYLDNVERLEKIQERLSLESYEFAQLSIVIQFFKGFYSDLQNKKFINTDAQEIPRYITSLYK